MKKLLSQIRITEVGDTSHRLVSLYKSTATLKDEAFLKPLFVEMEEKANALTEAVKRDAVISQLENADAKRDGAIRVLDRLLKGYKTIPLDTLKAYGVQLSAVFKKYGTSIAKKSYSEETHLIESLLKDLQNPNLSASITALTGVSEAIADLRNKQNAFAEVRAKYDDSMAQHQTLPSASSLKKPLYELINNKIIIYLNAMEVVEKEKFGSFIAPSNQVIESINTNIKARNKKEKTSKKKIEEKKQEAKEKTDKSA